MRPEKRKYGALGTAAVGRLTAMRDDSGQTIYAYDGFGRILTKRQSVGSGATARSFVLSRTYGATDGSTGHVTSITYPNGNRVEIAYDSNGRANSLAMTPALEQTPIGSAMDYLANTVGVNFPNWMWKAASATFAANADGAATAVILSTSPASVWATIEAPILSLRGIGVVFH